MRMHKVSSVTTVLLNYFADSCHCTVRPNSVSVKLFFAQLVELIAWGNNMCFWNVAMTFARDSWNHKVFVKTGILNQIYISIVYIYIGKLFWWVRTTVHCAPGPSCSKITMSLVNNSLKFLIEWYANMLKFFAEKMWVAFAVQKLLTFFQQKISEYCILNPLKQLTKWPLTSSLS